MLIAENAGCYRQRKPPLFTSLINPAYAGNAAPFATWLAGLLPSLAGWYERRCHSSPELLSEQAQPPENMDAEDTDLFILTCRYAAFLKEHNLFEPAWEKPPFQDDGNTYIIFYPEIIADFADYQDLLSRTPHVRIVKTPQPEELPVIQSYDNSRNEIAALTEHLLDIHTGGCPWQDIFIHIHDMEKYGPYIERELQLHAIPVVLRAGSPLTTYGAGRLFKLIHDCVISGFSFDTVKSLLLDENFPWKDKEAVTQLIEFGLNNTCLYSWKEDSAEKDIWLMSFAGPAGATENRARNLYKTLKKQLTALVAAPSFDKLRRLYFEFRTTFFDETAFSPQADAVLGRCIAELISLIDVEKTYPAAIPQDVYVFFLEHLSEKSYLPRQPVQGVNLLPYRAAAAAPSGCNIIAGASQQALTVTVKQMAFLREMKRAQLKLEDTDISLPFIQLYATHSRLPCLVTFAEKSFSGYAVAYGGISLRQQVHICKDAYAREQEWYLDRKNPFPSRLYAVQQEGFFSWTGTQSPAENPEPDSSAYTGNFCQNSTGKSSGISACKQDYSGTPVQPLPHTGFRNPARQYILDNFFEMTDNGCYLVRVSASALNDFSFCPLYWLFQRVLKIKPFSLDTDLVPPAVTGLIYHAVLHRFFSVVKTQPGGILLPANNSGLPPAYDSLLDESLAAIMEELTVSGAVNNTPVSTIARELIQTRLPITRKYLGTCLKSFLNYFGGYAVVQTEQYLSVQPARADCILGGFMDLVLADSCGNITIVDFKTKKPPERNGCLYDAETQTIRNIQLALYIELFEQVHREQQVAVDTALFFSIENAEPVVVVGQLTTADGTNIPSRNPVSRQEYEPAMNRFREMAAGYVQRLSSNAPLDTSTASYKDCAGCMYNTVCRSTYNVSGTSKKERLYE